ncbi:hypothetical protein SDJN03_00498, partial [Cucurbita argyrosperma subsp. sororia]
MRSQDQWNRSELKNLKKLRLKVRKWELFRQDRVRADDSKFSVDRRLSANMKESEDPQTRAPDSRKPTASERSSKTRSPCSETYGPFHTRPNIRAFGPWSDKSRPSSPHKRPNSSSAQPIIHPRLMSAAQMAHHAHTAYSLSARSKPPSSRQLASSSS